MMAFRITALLMSAFMITLSRLGRDGAALDEWSIFWAALSALYAFKAVEGFSRGNWWRRRSAGKDGK